MLQHRQTIPSPTLPSEDQVGRFLEEPQPPRIDSLDLDNTLTIARQWMPSRQGHEYMAA